MPRFKSGMQRWYEAKRTQDDQGDDDASASEEESDGGAAQEDETLPDSQERRLREPPPPEDPLIEAPGFDVSDIAVKMETEENDSRVAPKESSSSDLETSGCRETYGPEMQRALEDLGAQTLVNAQNTLTEDASSETLPPQPPVHVPRKRGRPRKNPLTPQPVKESRQPQTVSDSDNLLQVLESMRKEGLESSPKRLQNVGIHLPVLTPGEHYCMVCLARHQQRQSQGGRQTRSAMLKRCTTIMCRACNQFLCVSPRTDGRTCFDIFHTMQNFADSDLPEFKRSETDVIREEFIQEVDAQQALEAQRLLALLQEVSREASKTDATETEEARSEADPTVSDIGNTQESHELKPPDSMADPYKALEGEQQQQHLQQQQLQQLKQQLQQQQHSDVERIPEEVAESATSQADGPRAPMSAESQALELLLKFLNNPNSQPHSSRSLQGLLTRWRDDQLTGTLVTSLPLKRGRGRPRGSRTLRLGQSMRIAMPTAIGRRPRKATPQRRHLSDVEDFSEGDELLEDYYNKGDEDGEADGLGLSPGGSAVEDGDLTDDYSPEVQDPFKRKRGRPRKHKLVRLKPMGRNRGMKRKHRCTICEMTFVRADHLHHHILKHSSDKPFKCDQCSAAFKINSKLKEHLRVHTGERPFECQQCNQRFMRATHLKKHMMAHTGEKPFVCALCGRSFTNNASLKEHHYRHTGERPHKCNKCDVAFTRKISLQEHMRIHTGERPFKCPCCDMSFARRNGLRNHMTLHTGEKPYLCQTCGARFRHNTAFAEHVRIHTGTKPYVCQHCGTAFTCKSTLKKHVRLHTGEKPYKCSVCGAGFAQRTSLVCHIKKHPGLTLPAAFASHRTPKSDGPEVCINPVVGRNKKARLAQHHPQPQPQHLLHQHHHQQPQPQQPQQQQHQQQQQQHQQHQQHQQPQSIPSMPIGSPMAPPDRNLMNHTPTSNMTSRLGGQPGGVANTVSDEHSMGSMSDMTHSSPHHTHQVHSAQHPAQHPAQHSAHLGLAERGAAAADHRHSTSHLALGHWTQDPPGVAGFSYDHQVAHHGPHHLHHQAFPGVLPMPGQMAPAFPEQQRFPLDYRFSMT